LEVNKNGTIVWEIDVGTAYEAERLGTGDESAEGPSAQAAGLESVTVNNAEETDSGSILSAGVDVLVLVRDSLPPLLVNGVSVILPRWAGLIDLALFLAALGTVGTWIALEFRWSRYRLRSPFTIQK
jgi:hypothetical protein